MKKIHIAGIVLIAIAMAVILGLVINTDNYVGFEEAKERAGEKVTVIGELDHSKDIVEGPQSLSFYLKDERGDVQQVIIDEPMPDGFKRSESITVTGRMEGEVFKATHILMKCPSKYKKESGEVGAK